MLNVKTRLLRAKGRTNSLRRDLIDAANAEATAFASTIEAHQLCCKDHPNEEVTLTVVAMPDGAIGVHKDFCCEAFELECDCDDLQEVFSFDELDYYDYVQDEGWDYDNPITIPHQAPHHLEQPAREPLRVTYYPSQLSLWPMQRPMPGARHR